jgi:hypothetical protein
MVQVSVDGTTGMGEFWRNLRWEETSLRESRKFNKFPLKRHRHFRAATKTAEMHVVR